MTQILVVDDEAGIRHLLEEILRDEGYDVALADSASQAREFRRVQRPDVVLLDIWMPDSDGISLLREWSRAGQLDMPVIMMSGHGSIDTAVEATRLGAVDFLEKPVALQKLLATVARVLRDHEVRHRKNATLTELSGNPLFAPLARQLERVGGDRTPVLLVGEVGAGAELCARFLHRHNTPWVAPDSTAWLAWQPFDILSDAQNGLLYLQEISGLNRLEQKGLLMLIGKLEKFQVQLVVASARPLPALVAAGTFDPALATALGQIVLAIPSLAEHREAIPDLARIILSHLGRNQEAASHQFSDAALEALRDAAWQPSLTQLWNVVKTLALTAVQDEIGVEETRQALLPHLTPPAPAIPLDLDQPLRQARDEFERLYFEYHIERSGGNLSRVAQMAEMERTHLYRKLKKLGVSFSRKQEKIE